MVTRGQRIARMVVVGLLTTCCVVTLVVGGINAVRNAGKNRDARERVDAAMAAVEDDPAAAMDVLLAEIDAHPDMVYAADHDELAALLAKFPPDLLLATAAGGAEAALRSAPEMVELFEILCYATILGTYPDSAEAPPARTGLLTGGYYVEFDPEIRRRVVGALAAVADPAFFDELVAASQPDAGPDETWDEGQWEGKIAAQHTLAAKGQAGWEVLAAQVLAGDLDAAAAFESGGAGLGRGERLRHLHRPGVEQSRVGSAVAVSARSVVRAYARGACLCLRPIESFIVRIRSLENTRAAMVTNTANHTNW